MRRRDAVRQRRVHRSGVPRLRRRQGPAEERHRHEGAGRVPGHVQRHNCGEGILLQREERPIRSDAVRVRIHLPGRQMPEGSLH
ncbi:MAG: hypothetical protein WC483_04690 [Candidatus Paceibacterota bacterium]